MKNFFPFLEKKVDFALISGDTFEREDINLYTENKILDIFDKYDDIKIFMILETMIIMMRLFLDL